MKLKVGQKTHVGRVREKNEDALHADAETGLFIVADGLGGHVAGEVASTMAVDEIVRNLDEAVEPGEDALRDAVRSANEKVHEESFRKSGRRGMGTTVVVALIRENSLWLAHVGDSRAYLHGKEGLLQLTRDHTLFYDLGPDETGARRGYSGPLLRAIGIESQTKVDTRTLRYEGEGLLLCTDGLTNMLSREEMERLLASSPEPQEACDLLVEKANSKGGIDNITVILIRKE